MVNFNPEMIFLSRNSRRPDYCLGPHLRQMLSYGCTRLEIGVQSTYEDVARDTNRGHTVAAVADCFCLAKDAGFKVIACSSHSIVWLILLLVLFMIVLILIVLIHPVDRWLPT